MNGSYQSFDRYFVAFLASLLLAAAPASQPVDSARSLANDQVHFTPPPASAWTYRATNTPDSAYFQSAKGDGAIQLLWAPRDFQLAPDTASSFAVGIARDLKAKHAAKKDVVVLPPKIIRDSRFEIYIHEQFKVGDLTEDELHIYRSVGPRVLMATVSSVATEENVLTATHKAGENLLASAKYNRTAFKKSQ